MGREEICEDGRSGGNKEGRYIREDGRTKGEGEAETRRKEMCEDGVKRREGKIYVKTGVVGWGWREGNCEKLMRKEMEVGEVYTENRNGNDDYAYYYTQDDTCQNIKCEEE